MSMCADHEAHPYGCGCLRSTEPTERDREEARAEIAICSQCGRPLSHAEFCQLCEPHSCIRYLESEVRRADAAAFAALAEQERLSAQLADRDAKARAEGAAEERERALGILDRHAGPAPRDWAKVIHLIRSRGPAPERPCDGTCHNGSYPCPKPAPVDPAPEAAELRDYDAEAQGSRGGPLADPVDPVREAAKARLMGGHSVDCWDTAVKGGPDCSCGHDALAAALEKSDGES